MSYIAEQNVIGSLLMNPGCINEIYNLLEPEMFETEIYGEMGKYGRFVSKLPFFFVQ